jgi:hypothetical protein
MATRFASQFKRTAVPNLVRQFGESIVYHASGASGRPVDAIVVRDPNAILAEIGEALTGAMIVRVSNGNTGGISATTIDTGTDRVEIALIADGEKEMRSIVRVLSDSNGFVRFLVQ